MSKPASDILVLNVIVQYLRRNPQWTGFEFIDKISFEG